MSATKPTVFLDTNIFSILHGRATSIANRARQEKTREWWRLERQYFKLWTCPQTEFELSEGSYHGQSAAIAEARRLPYLAHTSEVENCALLYIEKNLVPETKEGDGIQLAFATIHKVDYLLTWNYAHLANPDMQARLIALNQKMGWRSPRLVSPDNIPWAALGQSLRRKT